MKNFFDYRNNPVLFLFWSYSHWIKNIIKG